MNNVKVSKLLKLGKKYKLSEIAFNHLQEITKDLKKVELFSFLKIVNDDLELLDFLKKYVLYKPFPFQHRYNLKTIKKHNALPNKEVNIYDLIEKEWNTHRVTSGQIIYVLDKYPEYHKSEKYFLDLFMISEYQTVWLLHYARGL